MSFVGIWFYKFSCSSFCPCVGTWLKPAAIPRSSASIAPRLRLGLAALLLMLLALTSLSGLAAATLWETEEKTTQAAYLAYYARSGDPAGVAYWSTQLVQSGGNLEAIIAAFSASQEFRERYPADMSDSVLIDTVFQQLFGRPADAAGQTYYQEALRTGRISRDRLMFDILNGASGTDVTVLENKLAASMAFTEAVAASDAIYNEASKGENIAMLASVGADPASVEAARAEIERYVETHQPTWNPANLVTIDPQNPPPNLFSGDELARLEALQSVTHMVTRSKPSPDEQTLFVQIRATDNMETGFLDIASGDFTAVTWPSGFAPVVASWRDAHLLRLIAMDIETDAYHLAEIDRRDGRVWVQTEPLPIEGDVSELSADGRRVAIIAAVEPQDASQTRIGTAAEDGVESVSERPRSVRRITLPTHFQSTRGFDEPLEVTAETSVLSVLDLDTLTARELITLPPTSSVEGISFSPDGERLAFVQNHVETGTPIDPARGGVIQSLTTLLTQDALGLLPPSENPLYINSQLLLFDLSDPEPVALTIGADQLPQTLMQFADVAPAWSPSGSHVLATANVPAVLAGRQWPTYYKPQAVSHILLDRELRVVDAIEDAPLSFPSQPKTRYWLSDDELLFVAVSQAEHRIYRYRLSGAQLIEVARAGTIHSILPLPASGRAVMVSDTVSEAMELRSVDLSSGAISQLTDFNTEATAAADVAAYPVDFTLADGERFSGFWFAPSTMAWPPQQEPVVFWQAGGPGGSMTNAWGTDVESPLTLLPSYGISVLMVPLQQRPGASPAVWNALADGDNFGSVDIDDMAEIADQLVAQGWTTAEGLGVTGCSYGGYMSSQSIVRHPTRWAAANPQCSLVDLISEFQIGYGAHIAYLMGATPWDAWLHYIDASPGYHGAQVQTPTLIFHGTKDFLSLAVMENFFYDIVVAGNADARMLRFLGEPHGLIQAASELYAAQEQIRWFRDYLR